MNQPILITGCQRSGTTLLNLILDSHPLVHGVDESEFREVNLPRLLKDGCRGPWVCLKLPTYSHDVRFIQAIGDVKILWCIRDPRDVVLSMMRLALPAGNGTNTPWAVHALGGVREIRNCLRALGKERSMDFVAQIHGLRKTAPNLVHALFSKRDGIENGPVFDRREEAVVGGSLCWCLKHEMLSLYSEVGMDFHCVVYEDLVSRPKSALAAALRYLGLPWDDDLLRHHQLHNGVSIGNTVNTRPIDSRNVGKWEGEFTSMEYSLIMGICERKARQFDYELKI